MNTQKRKWNNIPAVLVYEKIENIKGTILFYHGLGASKDIQMQDLKRLATDQFLVVGVDNVGHGERRYNDFEKRFSSENINFEKDFQQAVYQTAIEVPSLIDALQSHNLIKNKKIGITGISMGGFIAYRAVLEDKRLRAAVPILGSPYWENNDHSPHLFSEKFFPTPICCLNAGKDQSVPPQHSRNFCEQLQQHYGKKSNKIKYIEYPNSNHFMEQNDWDSLWNNMVKWFQIWL